MNFHDSKVGFMGFLFLTVRMTGGILEANSNLEGSDDSILDDNRRIPPYAF
jgi:hypothetical protein